MTLEQLGNATSLDLSGNMTATEVAIEEKTMPKFCILPFVCCY
jgi:hypothetical protein